MFRIPGTRKTLCDGATRRDFLTVGAISTFGLHLAHLLNSAAAADLGEGFGKAKSCILLFPYGSPSSHETFDPKPELPDIQGELKDIGSNVLGLRICEGLPRVSEVMDKVTVVRSMTHPYPVHGLAYAVSGLPTYTPDLEREPAIVGTGHLSARWSTTLTVGVRQRLPRSHGTSVCRGSSIPRPTCRLSTPARGLLS